MTAITRQPRLLVGLSLVLAACSGLVACGGQTTPNEPGPPTVSGVVSYQVRLTSNQGRSGTEWRPVRGAIVDIEQLSDGLVIARGETDADGHFSIQLGDNPPSELRARAVAWAQGPRINIVVVGSDVGLPPWSELSVEGAPNDAMDIEISEQYTAGAFHIIQLMYMAADALEPVVPASEPDRLRVRWGPDMSPPCGSCFYSDVFQLDLAGSVAEVDAWDDSVMLHEFGHYIEAVYGTYSNPGGLHNLEYVSPPLAWSEGFATWFASAVRQDPIYVDVQPHQIYQLDMETPPASTHGTAEGTVESRHSEALVYGALWDMTDNPPNDDDEAAFEMTDVLAAAIGLDSDGGPGLAGSEFSDWVNTWRCRQPGSDAVLAGVLSFFDYPYDLTQEALCE